MNEHNKQEQDILTEETPPEQDNTVTEPGKAASDEITVKKKKQNSTQQLREELDSLNDKLLRIAAEYDNYRKRTEKERQSLVSLGTSLALERLLPVLDTMEMAAEAESKDPEYKKGVELTLSMLISALKSLGIAEIESLGKPFDPKVHDCVASEDSDEFDSGTVIRVMQKGYRLNDRIIRPAMVAVSN